MHKHFGIKYSNVLKQIYDEYKDKEMELVENNSIREYLDSLLEDWNNYKSPILPSGVNLIDIYVDLKINGVPSISPSLYGQSNITKRENNKQNSPPFGYNSLSECLNTDSSQKKWVIFGDPGSGKTITFIKIAAKCSQDYLEHKSDVIPILILLNRLNDISSIANIDSISALFDIYGHITSNSGFEKIYDLRTENKYLLLFDGVDEISHKLFLHINKLFKKESTKYDNLTLVFSSRRVGYNPIPDIKPVELAKLSIEQQKYIILKICGRKPTPFILRIISSKYYLREFTKNPMLLSLLVVIIDENENYLNESIRNYSDIFHMAIQILFYGGATRKGISDPDVGIKIIANLSYDILTNTEAHANIEYIHKHTLHKYLDKHLHLIKKIWGSLYGYLNEISEYTNVLYPMDTYGLRFKYIHKTFIEYFAALHISLMEPDQIISQIETHLDNDMFSEALVLLCSIEPKYYEVLAKLKNIKPIMALRLLASDKLLSKKQFVQACLMQTRNRHYRKELYTLLQKSSNNENEKVGIITDIIRTLKNNIPKIDLYFMLAIADQFREDNKKTVTRVVFNYLPSVPENVFADIFINVKAEPYWVYMPEGTFKYGSNLDKPDWVLNEMAIRVEDYKISRVLVTNRFYEIFDPLHISERAFNDIIDNDELDDHPVVNVSWYEAKMFCIWLGSSGIKVDLPTELQWEKAAKCDNENSDRVYPWGNEWDPTRVNTWECGPNHTTRVGSYQNGKSYLGAYDMIGNTWEWVRDSHIEDLNELTRFLAGEKVLDQGSINNSYKVDKGGGWYKDVGHPTNYLRAVDFAADIFTHCGFRIVSLCD